MADRTSAELFGKVFEALAKAKAGTLTEKTIGDLAAEFWALTHDYDFSEYQMDCDDALIALGLARMVVDVRERDDIEYGPK